MRIQAGRDGPIGPTFDDDISAAVIHLRHEDRVQHSLSVLDQAIHHIATGERSGPTNCAADFVELDADDLFDIVSIVMELDEPAARQVGLAGLVNALTAPDLEALQISCLAVQRFCGFVGRPSQSHH